jgi:hypothetical protein
MTRMRSVETDGHDPVLLNLCLIETMSFGGNSGAPVFFHLGADREPGQLNLSAPIFEACRNHEGRLRPRESYWCSANKRGCCLGTKRRHCRCRSRISAPRDSFFR